MPRLISVVTSSAAPHWRRAGGVGRGDATPPPHIQNSRGNVPYKSRCKVVFLILNKKFRSFKKFEIKVTEIRGEIKIWGK